MDNQGAKTIIHTLRDALFQFATKSRKLASPMLQQFGCASEPVTVDEEELRVLKSKLRRIHATLRDAESQSVTDHSVRLWLSELGDLEYRAEDVLEELEYESRRAAQLEELKIDLLRAASTGKRKREVSLLFAAAPVRRLRRKIDDIWARYEEIASDRKKLRLRPGDGVRVARPVLSTLVPSSSLPRGQLHGRLRDLEKVAELVRQPDCSRNYAVVPIVGMAGVGKTALMQHVCGMEAVASHFDLTLWIWVSQEFDVVSLTAKIVEAITRTRPEGCELSTLHEVIAERVKGKRCLIVLDDMWDANPFLWNSLTAPLMWCAPGSTVVVTTRSMKVAKMMSPKVHQLSCLSDENCWLVCQGSALHNGSVNIDQELARIGQQIAKKCRGLPLAAEAVGSALSTSISWKHWNQVLESNLWADNIDVKNLVLPALKLSYDHLSPPLLKRCFALCSLFPKGFVFNKDALVQLWTAHGFLDAERDSCPDVIGNGYFDDLVSRSFFQHSLSHDISEGKFFMHDLYQELAQFVSGNECRMIHHHDLRKMDENTRHLSLIHRGSHSEKEIYWDSFSGHDLRTLLFVARMEQDHGEMPFRTKIPCELVLDFECLRALDLSNTNMMELPKSVGSLIHLRYLCLENTGIQVIPESIGALFNLQTIKLNHCSSLTRLPQSIKLLLNLRCLEIPHSNIQIPSGIGVLTRLQRLPVFTAGNVSAGCSIEELNELVNLRGDLHIIGLNKQDAAHSANVNLWKKEGLQKLTLEWSDIHMNLHMPNYYEDTYAAGQVLQDLVPNTNLEELIIKGYNGPSFPSWLGCLSLGRLASVELKDCQNCEELPPLGRLPSLKHVLIQSLPSVKLVGPEFFGDNIFASSRSEMSRVFPALESLKFRNMECWEEWSGVKDEHFPKLKYLSIARCCKLKVLPQFTSGPKLRIRYCEKLRQLPLCQKRWNLMKYIQPPSELSYTCTAEGDISILEASRS